MEPESAKGVRDFGPEEMILRQRLLQTIRDRFERFGFSPMETPTIERYDVLTAKFGAGTGTDVMKEIFTFQDQGERELGLKFDQTVPLARYMAQNPHIKLPFKRYTIDRAYRDGPVKVGRYREFYQCDVDIVGSHSMCADAELVTLMLTAFESIGLHVRIEINHRKVLGAVLRWCQIPDELEEPTLIVIDKLKKLTEEELASELSDVGLTENQSETLLRVLKTIQEATSDAADNEGIIATLRETIPSDEMKTACDELSELLSYIPEEEKKRVYIVASLARGLNYYTGPVFEAFLQDGSISSSLAGGGRFDNMIGGFCGRDMPAVGTSLGLAPITAAVQEQEEKTEHSVSQVYIIPIHQHKEAFRLAQDLRREGINTEVDLNGRGVSKNLDYVNSKSIPYAIFLGEKEVNAGKVKLRDMHTGQENLVRPQEAASTILGRSR